jgi:RND family efflux transporter MFP subunit
MRAGLSLVFQGMLSLALLFGAYQAWTHQDALRSALGLTTPEPERRANPNDRGIPVVVAAVAQGRDDLVIEAVGTGRARRSIDLRPKVEGKVVASRLAAGARFETGDILLELEDEDRRLARDLAEAELAEATRVLERYEALQGRAVTSQASLTEVTTAREIARINRDRAESALEDRKLRAPFDGVTGLPEVEIGDWVTNDVTVASFDDRSEILVEFMLQEALLSRLTLGADVSVRTPSLGMEDLFGVVDSIDTRVDPVSRTTRVRIAIPNGDDRLRPGASFTVTLRLPGAPYAEVPALALQFERGGSYLWRIEDGKASRVPVRLVRRDAGTVLVDGALSPGDPVVVEGVQRLREGRPVEIIGGDPEVVEGLAQGLADAGARGAIRPVLRSADP